MIRLHLYGQMKKDYGDHMDLEASSPRAAVTALAYQCPKYKKYLLENSWHVILGDKENEISEKELDISLGKYQEVHLIPAIEGQGKYGSAIAGAVIFVVGAVLTYTGIGAGVGVNMMWMGGAMMLGGLIAATTKVPGAKETKKEEIDKRASFLFSGAVNSSTQGLPIPRGYGRVLIGSSVVSAAVYAEQLE